MLLCSGISICKRRLPSLTPWLVPSIHLNHLETCFQQVHSLVHVIQTSCSLYFINTSACSHVSCSSFHSVHAFRPSKAVSCIVALSILLFRMLPEPRSQGRGSWKSTYHSTNSLALWNDIVLFWETLKQQSTLFRRHAKQCSGEESRHKNVTQRANVSWSPMPPRLFPFSCRPSWRHDEKGKGQRLLVS